MSDTTSGRYLAVTKSGAGTLFLSGTNTYSGPTTVNQGALIVKGTVSNSTVTVNSGAVFGGNGTVTGMVSFSDGSIFTNNVGAPLTAGILNMAGNATMKFTTAIALAAGNYPLYCAPIHGDNSGDVHVEGYARGRGRACDHWKFLGYT